MAPEINATGTVAQMSSECFLSLKTNGFNFFTGVADSLLASLIEEMSRDSVGYIPAVREDLAVGLASGAFLGGRLPCILMQNSGIGYCLNALMSLNLTYKIPLLLMVGYRGYLGKDAPEHLVMGAHCEALLRRVGIPVFVPDMEQVVETVNHASRQMKATQSPVAILIRPGIF